jgi:hypothetical protein
MVDSPEIDSLDDVENPTDTEFHTDISYRREKIGINWFCQKHFETWL